MKITKTPDMVRSSLGSGDATSIGGVTVGPPDPPSGPGQGIISSTSNTASWQPVVSTITSNGSNVLLGPNVNLASGSNIVFSVASNTLTIHSTVAPAHSHTGYLSTVDGGGGTVYPLGSLTGTINVNTANGNYQWGTFTGNTTFTFTTTTDTAERWFTLELIEGAGGHSPTWPGSVVWLGGTTPTHTTTAGTTTIYAFFTRNGGTTWIGGQLGQSAVGELDDLSDVVITNAQLGDILRHDGTIWRDYAGHYEPVIHDFGSGPDIVYDSGDIVMEWFA